jgi:hypothetical protein
MKINYKLVSGGGYLPLADDTSLSTVTPPANKGQAINMDFKPSFKPAVQQDMLFRSQAAFRVNRGNIVLSIPLTVTVEYSTLASALASIRAFAGLLDQVMHLQVIQDTETQYYPNALLQAYDAEPSGASIVHRFLFASDNVTDTAV